MLAIGSPHDDDEDDEADDDVYEHEGPFWFPKLLLESPFDVLVLMLGASGGPLS